MAQPDGPAYRKGLTAAAANLLLFLLVKGYPRWVLLPALALLALQQNFWMWGDDSLWLGVPANLLYHVSLCLLVPLIMLVVVRRAWPDFPDEG